MLMIKDLELRYPTKLLFQDVNLEFKDDCCYGIIGANGSGKSTLLKIIGGEIESTRGEIILGKGERISSLVQDHNIYNDCKVIDVVIMGNKKLYNVMLEKERLYSKENFTDKDGIRLGELEEEFLNMNGWNAESDAIILLNGLGVNKELYEMYMYELKDSDKVKVLLARALFGEPDVLLLDEPTNGLDIKSKIWLEEFLINFKNTVLIVSHDRAFLNKVCTHIVDIDFEKATMFVGNYDFWYKSSQLILKQMKDSNKKKEEKIKELEDFIRRFSANASKSKQATSRKKALEKIQLDEIKASSRKYPYINFDMDRELGNDVIIVDNICYKNILNNVKFVIRKNDKIALIGNNEIAKTALLNIISGNLIPDSGSIKIGTTVKVSYYEKDHESYFNNDKNMIEWLRQYTNSTDDTFIRGFLGRMLFSGEDAFKNVKVLSGGEKVRCMFAKIMLNNGNLLLLDEPTNHLDMESITSLNEGLERFRSSLIISTYDEEIINTVCNRLIEIKKDGSIRDKEISYNEYIEKFGLDLV